MLLWPQVEKGEWITWEEGIASGMVPALELECPHHVPSLPLHSVDTERFPRVRHYWPCWNPTRSSDVSGAYLESAEKDKPGWTAVPSPAEGCEDQMK